MTTAFERLKVAEREFDEDVDLSELRKVIDSLEVKFCKLAYRATLRGDHLLHGCSSSSWVASTCRMSKHAAADRLCVGQQLESLPTIARSAGEGEIGYQATSVVCHLSEQLGEKRDHIEEEQWVDYAQRFSIKQLRHLTLVARHAWDPDGFEKDSEEDYEQRYLHLSPLGRMWKLDAVLDSEGGAALRTAIDALSHRLGQADTRSPKQRRADGLVELCHYAMDKGTLPRRSGVRPHITVTTTLQALKGELGAAASELQDGTPVSSKTVQRLAFDGTLCRVLKADSMVTDVGRATRSIFGSQRRAVNARCRTCCGPGCDRPVSMTSVHHIEFWGQGGPNNLPNMVPLCYFHHRLVHEGGWHVVRVTEGIRWIPPDRLIARWAA